MSLPKESTEGSNTSGPCSRLSEGRKRLDDQAALNGILFVLHTGIAWRDLLTEFGYGSGVTCWRRLRELAAGGVWEQLHQAVPAKLNGAGELDWSRVAADSTHIRVLLGGLNFMHHACAIVCRRRLRSF